MYNKISKLYNQLEHLDVNNTNTTPVNTLHINTTPVNTLHINTTPVTINTNPTKLELKWSDTSSIVASDPSVWGPAFWLVLHTSAANYPEKSSTIAAARMKGFILGIPVMIPCDVCSMHSWDYIESRLSELDEICSNRNDLFHFFWELHSKVNKRYGKPNMSLKDAWKKYTSKVNVSSLEYK